MPGRYEQFLAPEPQSERPHEYVVGQGRDQVRGGSRLRPASSIVDVRHSGTLAPPFGQLESCKTSKRNKLTYGKASYGKTILSSVWEAVSSALRILQKSSQTAPCQRLRLQFPESGGSHGLVRRTACTHGPTSVH